MKKLVFAVMLACVSVVPAMADKVSTAETAEFKALVDKCAAAWATLKPDNVAPLYAKDADLVYFDLAPLKYTGWAEYDKGVRQVFASFETLALTPGTDLKVSKSGKVAWTTGTMHATAKMKGTTAPMELDARQTLIWEKREGKWVIIHEHLSAPLPPGPEGAPKSE